MSASASAHAGRDLRVEELCTALHAMPEARRAECCKQAPSLELTDECRRGLDGSLALAAIALDATAVHTCATALAAAYEGCEHVGPNHPAIPPSCVGIVRGLLPAKSKCRSSLECLEGLRCHGVGPTTAGACDVPHANGEPCGLSIDVLATYTGQKELLTKHPECSGVCDRQKCIAPLSLGAACAEGAQCGPGATCTGGKCLAVKQAKLGQPCPQGACEEGARCAAGKCVAPKAAGEACDVDRECLGGCLKAPGEKSGTCGMRCDLP